MLCPMFDQNCWSNSRKRFLIHPRLLVFRRHRTTRCGIAWRPPRCHLIAIKFLM